MGLKKLILGVSYFMVLSALSTGSALAETRYWKRLIALDATKIRPLNADGSVGAEKTAEEFVFGEKITYQGDAFMVYGPNGISAMRSSDGGYTQVKTGQIFYVCKNQYMDHREFSADPRTPGKKVVLAHFVLRLESTHAAGEGGSACRCGMCGDVVDVVEDPATLEGEVCPCKAEAPIDPGTQACVIM